VKKALNIWPAVLPIFIFAKTRLLSRRPGVTNIITALNQRNRVGDIVIWNIPNSLLNKFATMKKPFPALTHLQLDSSDENAPVVPDSFLGGSAPRLQRLWLFGIPFLGLPKLLSTTSDLVSLQLWRIPESGYISPEAMVTSLSALTRLEDLGLGFRSPRPRIDRPSHRLPAHARFILHTLTSLQFKGTSEYLEEIVYQIETPRLGNIGITFFNQLAFDTPRLRHFTSRTQILEMLNQADISLSTSQASIRLSQKGGTTHHNTVDLRISSRAPDWQLSSLSQLCTSSFPLLPTLERLEIHDYGQDWHEDVEHIQWLELLHPFVSVKDLTIHKKLVRLVARALRQLVGERVLEVLPALQNLFLEGSQSSDPVRKAIVKFIVVRRLSGHPVTVYHQARPGKGYVRSSWGNIG
jgi:hypothetical protein